MTTDPSRQTGKSNDEVEDRIPDLVRSGRRYQSQRSFLLLIGVVSVGALAVAAPCFVGRHAGAPGAVWAGVLAATLVVLLLAAFVARRTGACTDVLRNPTATADPLDDKEVEPVNTATAGGVVICCSGGGIKSASYCMGALQRLEEQADVWGAVDAIVGVSGGGYMAAAWAVAAHRAEAEAEAAAEAAAKAEAEAAAKAAKAEAAAEAAEGEAAEDDKPRQSASPGEAPKILRTATHDWSTDRMQALRARTNYLASSGRTRFDLLGSIGLGVVLNVMLLAGPLVTLAWLVGGYAIDTGLVESPLTVTWANWWVLAPSLVMALVAVLMFMSKRFAWGSGAIPRDLLGRLEDVYWRVVAGENRAHEDSERLRFFAEAPNTILRVATGYVIAVPMLIWTAQRFHQETLSPSDLAHYLWLNKDKISWGLASLAAMAGLSHSGAKSPLTEMGPIGAAWRMLRRQVAPWTALLIIAGFAYWAAALLTAREMHQPLTGWWAVGAAAAMLVLPLLVGLIGSANLTSVFTFYRDRLAYAYLGPAWDDFGSATTSKSSPAELTLAEINSPAAGSKLVLMATANASGAGYLPTGRNGMPFILSGEVGFPNVTGPFPRATGLAATYCLDGGKPITVAEAMAISGAAVSPQAGRESKNLGGYRLLLALGNVRTGAWAPNPYFGQITPATGGNWWVKSWLRLNDLLDHHTALYVVREAFVALRLDTPYVYLTDGGHYDNLGLVEALRRQPSTIYVLDGTGDAEDSFAAVGDAIATARMDLGTEVTFNPAPLRRGKGRYPERAWTTMQAMSPKDKQWSCTIIYVKAILPEGFTFDLYAFEARNPGFPTGLERIEMLDEFDFEAYRQLGWCATDSALAGTAIAAPAPTQRTCRE